MQMPCDTAQVALLTGGVLCLLLHQLLAMERLRVLPPHFNLQRQDRKKTKGGRNRTKLTSDGLQQTRRKSQKRNKLKLLYFQAAPIGGTLSLAL